MWNLFLEPLNGGPVYLITNVRVCDLVKDYGFRSVKEEWFSGEIHYSVVDQGGNTYIARWL